MEHFVTSYTNHNKERKRTAERAQYGLEIIFTLSFTVERTTLQY